MREIGSEFWDVPTGNNESSEVFPESIQWLLSGRSALKAILSELVFCRSVALPSWCCESMIKPFLEAGIEVRFYPVYWNKKLIRELRFDCDILFLIDYFGYTDSSTDLKNYKGVIIRDVTHSIFSQRYKDADWYFGSLRKWCGIWTGGFLWSQDGHQLSVKAEGQSKYPLLRKQAMRKKAEYISNLDTTSEEPAFKSYLNIFKEAEDFLEHAGIEPASQRDVHLIGQLDINGIKTRRRANAEILRTAFQELLIFPTMKDNDCPMFVPILVPSGHRDQLKKYLIRNDIFCPVHWPISTDHQIDEKTGRIYHDELSLVCDQRYTKEDMERMVETIQQFREEI